MEGTLLCVQTPLADQRRKKVSSLIADHMDNSLPAWKVYCQRIAKSDFLTGLFPPSGEHAEPFRASFDWAIRETNFQRTMEGQFDNRERGVGEYEDDDDDDEDADLFG